MSIFTRKSSNPVLSYEYDKRQSGAYVDMVNTTNIFSPRGVALKVLLGIGIMVAIFVLLLLVPTVTYMLLEIYLPLVLISSVAIIGLVIYGRKNPTNAKIAFIGYSIIEGFLVSLITIVYSISISPEIVLTAIGITVLDVLFMCIIYSMNPNIVTEKFKAAMGAAIGAVGVFYLISFVTYLMGISTIDYYSPLSIGVSVVIVIIASLTLLLDFKMIDEFRTNQLPKEYEWIAALGLLVTIIWIYLEVLRLLSKFSKRR